MADVPAVVPPTAAPDSDGARRRQFYQGGRAGRGGGRGNNPPGTKPKEKASTEEKTSIPGIPSFCTPAENGDKALFKKVRSLLKRTCAKEKML